MHDQPAPGDRLTSLESGVEFVMSAMRNGGAQIPPASLADTLMLGMAQHGAPAPLMSTLVGVVACLRLYATDGVPDVFTLPCDEGAR